MELKNRARINIRLIFNCNERSTLQPLLSSHESQSCACMLNYRRGMEISEIFLNSPFKWDKALRNEVFRYTRHSILKNGGYAMTTKNIPIISTSQFSQLRKKSALFGCVLLISIFTTQTLATPSVSARKKTITESQNLSIEKYLEATSYDLVETTVISDKYPLNKLKKKASPKKKKQILELMRQTQEEYFFAQEPTFEQIQRFMSNVGGAFVSGYTSNNRTYLHPGAIKFLARYGIASEDALAVLSQDTVMRECIFTRLLAFNDQDTTEIAYRPEPKSTDEARWIVSGCAGKVSSHEYQQAWKRLGTKRTLEADRGLRYLSYLEKQNPTLFGSFLLRLNKGIVDEAVYITHQKRFYEGWVKAFSPVDGKVLVGFSIGSIENSQFFEISEIALKGGAHEKLRVGTKLHSLYNQPEFSLVATFFDSDLLLLASRQLLRLSPFGLFFKDTAKYPHGNIVYSDIEGEILPATVIGTSAHDSSYLYLSHRKRILGQEESQLYTMDAESSKKLRELETIDSNGTTFYFAGVYRNYSTNLRLLVVKNGPTILSYLENEASFLKIIDKHNMLVPFEFEKEELL